jgi:hypothetical protein
LILWRGAGNYATVPSQSDPKMSDMHCVYLTKTAKSLQFSDQTAETCWSQVLQLENSVNKSGMIPLQPLQFPSCWRPGRELEVALKIGSVNMPHTFKRNVEKHFGQACYKLKQLSDNRLREVVKDPRLVYHKTMCDYICIVQRVSTGSTIASSAMVGKRKSADVSIVHCREGFAWNITAEKWDKEGGFTPWCWAIEMIRHPVLGHIYYRHVQTDSQGVAASPPPWSVVRFKPEIGSISNGMVDDLPGKDDCKKVTRGIIAGPEGDTFLRNVAGCWTEAYSLNL